MGAETRVGKQHARGSALYFLVAAVLFIPLAWMFGVFLPDQPANRDVWQAAAAIKALIDNPWSPTNPFIAAGDSSRHFQPYWLSLALIARSHGLDHLSTLGLAAYFSLTVMAVGIFVFARAYWTSRWAPLILLLTMVLGWLLPLIHTGFHSPLTLLHGAAYPATLLIGLTLILWASAIHALNRTWFTIVIFGLAALMFTTHQLGAAIGFIGAACLAALHGNSTLRTRGVILASMLAGIAVSALWPYHNPIALVLVGSTSSWDGGPNFYGLTFMSAALIPSALGLIGLIMMRENRAMLAAFALYFALYLTGLLGIQIAARFLMPAVLVLHIGLAAIIIESLVGEARDRIIRPQFILAAVPVFALTLALVLWRYGDSGIETAEDSLSPYAAAIRLTDDIAGDRPIAAYSIAVWPIVATGQRAYSVPWPEPAIRDLSQRQQANRQLFDPALARQQRQQLASDMGVRFVFVDVRYVPSSVFDALERQASASEQAGFYVRFDLSAGE